MTNAAEVSIPFTLPPLGYTALSDKNKDFSKPGTLVQGLYHIPCTKCLDQHFVSAHNSVNPPKDSWIDAWDTLLILDAWERVDFGVFGPIKHWHVVLLKVLQDEKVEYVKIERTNSWIHLDEYFALLNPQ